jgi:hypothetical protein
MTFSPQQAVVYDYLSTHAAITTRTATRELEIYRLSERIRELEKMGARISRRMVETKNGARVMEYTLTGYGFRAVPKCPECGMEKRNCGCNNISR